jgi:hypothetical protein
MQVRDWPTAEVLSWASATLGLTVIWLSQRHIRQPPSCCLSLIRPQHTRCVLSASFASFASHGRVRTVTFLHLICPAHPAKLTDCERRHQLCDKGFQRPDWPATLFGTRSVKTLMRLSFSFSLTTTHRASLYKPGLHLVFPMAGHGTRSRRTTVFLDK